MPKSLNHGEVSARLRVYGHRPYNVAVIHGGPGAPGEMAPVARELSAARGILEPLQAADSVEGQVQELHTALSKYGDFPVILVGWSWGAWLSYIFATEYPSLIGKLILVSSGPFEEKYAAGIMATRLSRLNSEDKERALSLLDALNGPDVTNKDKLMPEFGKLMSRADTWDPLSQPEEPPECQPDVYQKVWQQASRMRSSGKLLGMGQKSILCPVVAIHGDYDPHPAEGVREPLSQFLRDFRFILLDRCGHQPWNEKEARDRFYAILKREIE